MIHESPSPSSIPNSLTDYEEDSVHTCPLCHGEQVIRGRSDSDVILDEMCPVCDGEGEVWTA